MYYRRSISVRQVRASTSCRVSREELGTEKSFRLLTKCGSSRYNTQAARHIGTVWGYRLEVRTRDFQSLSRGSIPRIPTLFSRFQSGLQVAPRWWNGRHVRLRCVCSQGLQVQLLSSALYTHRKDTEGRRVLPSAVCPIFDATCWRLAQG